MNDLIKINKFVEKGFLKISASYENTRHEELYWPVPDIHQMSQVKEAGKVTQTLREAMFF